ncbi:diguanylate cyclase domain-containing protein [Ilumatobacter sp.]|uniref:GGDEF domain-containing protein n=1 Tax=Ilumatobacter sp. TaxID=1967498 RepID=UPI003B516B61
MQPDDIDDDLTRLKDLYALDLIDAPVDERFAPYTRLAARCMGAPIAHVTLLGDDRQVLCAPVGIELSQGPREESFCTHIVDDDLGVLVVEDTREDPRFRDLPMVRDEPNVRSYIGAPITTGGGHVVGTMCVLDLVPRRFDPSDHEMLLDLVVLVAREIDHASLALTDDLTGLANRRSFMAVAESFLALARRHDGSISVVFVDVDRLKQVNDEDGHAAGDDVLRRAASALSSSVRDSDLVARLGGDEFGVVMYGPSPGELGAVVERLTAAVAGAGGSAPPGRSPSMSCGTATSRAGDSVLDVLARADAAMYDAKRRASAARVDAR